MPHYVIHSSLASMQMFILPLLLLLVLVVTSAILIEGGYVITCVCLSVCLSVS